MLRAEKLKVLIGCLLFKEFTGSEMYVYELSKNLIKLDCEVTVTSPFIGGKLTDLAINLGIKVKDINKLDNSSYDIIHTQHKPITEFLINKYPFTKKICSIHSEIISLEEPVLHPSIKQYIAIRPSIKDLLVQKYNISSDLISIIYNPVDEERFKPINHKDHNSILFVGTLDYLRKDTIFDLIEYSNMKNMDFWLIGEDKNNYLNEILKHKHVKYSKSVSDIEKYFQRCNETAGILLGRTTIEGWMCGKPGWIYDVDNKGKILKKTFHHPPDDIHKFYSSVVSKKIRNLY